MASVLQDIRFGFRLLAKSPLSTCVALVTLALGIGGNTAVFSVVHSVLLSPLPYSQPERLVRITAELRGQGIKDVGLSANELFDYQQRSDLFEGLSGLFPIDANLTGADQPTRAEALLV